jgi:mannose-6-phosphate isomerase-like protein (cupin superfamily)
MTTFPHDRTARPVLVRASDAEILGLGGNSIQLLADGDPAGAISAARTRMDPATDGPPPHYHANAQEIFFIISGRLHVLLAEQVVTVDAGDFLVVPPHTLHAFATPSDTGVDLLFLMPGVARFDYFRLADRIRTGAARPQEILETQGRFDNHFQDSAVWRQFTRS